MHPLEDNVKLAEKYTRDYGDRGVKVLPALEHLVEQRTDGMSGVPPPPIDLKKENNNHRIMLYLAAAGNNVSEIAGITGYSPQHTSTVMRQDWFQKQLAGLLEESGKPVVEHLLQMEAKASLDVLIQLRDGQATPPAVKMNCAFNILDRVLGKAVQKTESVNHNFNRTSTMSMEELDKEQARLATEELRLRGA